MVLHIDKIFSHCNDQTLLPLLPAGHDWSFSRLFKFMEILMREKTHPASKLQGSSLKCGSISALHKNTFRSRKMKSLSPVSFLPEILKEITNSEPRKNLAQNFG